MSKNDNNIPSENEQDTETWARDFLENVTGEKANKVKNFSEDPIPEEIEAFCSLGPKACPVELDVNTARLDTEINAFFRRLKLTKHFEGHDDQRNEEEKRFYTKNLILFLKGGKSAPLDMFIFEFNEKWRNWKPRRRIKDNLTALERRGKI